MKEHEHATQNKPTTVPAHVDLTKKVTETKAPHAGTAHHAHSQLPVDDDLPVARSDTL